MAISFLSYYFIRILFICWIFSPLIVSYFYNLYFVTKLPQATLEMGNKESNVDYSTAAVEAPTTSVMVPAVKLPNRNSLCLETGHGKHPSPVNNIFQCT